MSEYAIEIKGLNKTYAAKGGEPKVALRDVDLVIERGAFYGLLGSNGAGKSTLINIMAGLVNKTSGRVVIDGVDQDEAAIETRRRIGVVPQEVFLDPFFPVAEMLEFYAGYYGIKKADRRTEELLEALSLADQRNVSVRKLSGGMRRRLLIAKALVHSPPIVVLDEPTAGVDVELRTQLWDYVREINARGTTILLTTHYLEEAQELCDRISIIDHGQVVVTDSTKNLMGRLDCKQMIVTLAEPNDALPKMPAQVVAKQLDGVRISISYPPSVVGMDALLGALMAAKLTIVDLSIEEPDLEDVFRDIVGGGKRVA